MKSVKILVLFIFVVFHSVSFAQNNGKKPSQNQNSKVNVNKVIPKNSEVNSKPKTEQVNIQDFKITASNSSYIEIEFTPQYFNDYDFRNSYKDLKSYGKPDLGFRTFPVFLTNDLNNKIDIVDFKYTDVAGIDVPSVPTPFKIVNKMDISLKFTKDNTIYNSNNLYPNNSLSLVQNGKLRNKYYGVAKIYPALYFPMSKTLRKYTYIKFRITFGGNPIYSNKQLSKEELSFFNGLALNSSIAKNWSTKEFNSLPLHPNVTNSVLRNGDFFKVEVKETGFYKIDKNLLISAGISVNDIDPRTIKMYNNGGAELPFDNFTSVTDDLNEIRIYVEGEADGHFDDADYILFYGLSPNDWQYSFGTRKYSHYLNHYCTSNFYFLTYGGLNGKRFTNVNSVNIGNLTPFQSFTDKFFDEPEINNLGSTGNLWVSQVSNAGDAGFSFSRQLTGLIDNSPIHYALRFGNGSPSYTATFLIKEDHSDYSTMVTVDPATAQFSHIYMNINVLNGSVPVLEDDFYNYAGNNNLSLNLSLPSLYNNSNITAYYDYLELFYKRSFSSVVNNSIRIFADDTLGTYEFQVSPFTTQNVKIFDVSNYSNVSSITPISYSNGIVRFQDNLGLGSLKQYWVIGGDNYKAPVSMSKKIANQDLHGSYNDGASFVIITPTEFIPAANTLKSMRESPGQGNPNYLKTYIFDINQIFNEFGCGIPDPVAMRNFLKYAYNNWSERPVYVLFLGDGSYDYKNIVSSVKNYIPPIEKPDAQSSELDTYPSDDFITDITESHQTPDVCVPDFASGRFNVNTLSDANTIISKIQAYESTTSFGIWKKTNMYVADDGWTTENTQGQEGSIHTDQCERIAELCTPPDFEKDKVYIVAYPTVITPQGRRKPGANIDIIKGWNEGRLVINYVGHGSSDLWAHEEIFVRDESIPQMTNVNKYPLVTIASCDLARWDDPLGVSAAEELVYVDQKGAIAVIAATRPVFSNYNATFNEGLWNNFMYLKDTLNLPIRIGKALYNDKNQLSLTDNDMKYCLVGDPTLRISIPQYFTRIDSINNTGGNDTAIIKALQKVRITGSILHPDSTFWNNYNGDITIKILDVDRNILLYDFGIPFSFKLDGGTIFNGSTKIVNGKWIVEFVVPKDISYNNGNGKLMAYFRNQSTEGSGYTGRFIMNGIDSSAEIDTIGPQISVFLGNRNFRSGDMVNQNTNILADFYDKSGINLTGAIGHDIEAVINNDDNNKINLPQYYNNTNGYQYGTLTYALSNLSDGKYNLKIRAWDTYNNFSVASVDFVVQSNSTLALDKIYNYPNPMKDKTTFTFEQNSDSPINVKIKIFTVTGRLIRELDRTNITDKNVVIDWDGKDSDGDAIANGVYIYKVFINSEDGNFSNNTIGKLAKLK